MRKSFNILLVLLIAFFTLPFGGYTVSAGEKVYDNIKDGEYDITVKAINADKDEPSGAAGFIEEDAVISVQDGTIELTITIPHNEMAQVSGLQIEGNEPKVIEDEEAKHKTYTLEHLKSELMAQVQYEVPMLDMKHDVPFKFVLEGLDELPIIEDEPEEPENPEEESENPEEPEDPAESEEPETPGNSEGDESDESGDGEESNNNSENENDSTSPLEELDNGSYEVKVSYVRSDNDDESTMARYMNDTAFVTVKDGEAEVTITVNDHHTVTKLLVDDHPSVVAKLDGNKRYETFKLDRLASALDAYVEYQAPYRDSVHYGNADFRIVFDEEDIVEAEVEQQPGYAIEETLLLLDDGYYLIDASYINQKDGSASAMGRYLGGTVFTSFKDGKVLLTMTVNDHETVTGLQINGKDAVEKVVDGNNRYETFEFDDLVSLTDAYVEYQVGTYKGNADFNISFDEKSIQTAEASDQPGSNVEDSNETEVELNQSTPVKKGEIVTIKGDDLTQLTMPDHLPEDVKVNIRSVKDNVKNQGDLEIAGEVYQFDFENLGENPGTFELVMSYDQDKYNSEDYEVDIYYFDGQEWIAQNGTIKNGKITVEVDHFSTYGVFAKKIDKSGNLGVKVPKDAEEIDYDVMHENGKEESTANSFFEKPALLFEKDGKSYVQVTITNGDMVKDLSTKHGEAVIVKEHKDGSIDVQFIVNDDLSDTILNMRVVVPGMYDKEHTTLFVINSEEESETPSGDPKPVPKPKPDPKPTSEEPEDEELLTPDRVYEIDYVIKHKDGSQESVANDFFVKPGLLLEKDGKKYVQLTITNGDMVKGLKNKYGNALLVKKNDDESIVVQLRVDNDLSDMLLDMHIIVPGLYNADHQALLVFNKDSLKEIDPNDHKLAGTNVKDGNGTYIEGPPEKPEFGDGDNGDNGDNGKGEDKKTLPKSENPQTGDTTNIYLYAMLLIGSLIPLAIKLRRRFA